LLQGTSSFTCSLLDDIIVSLNSFEIASDASQRNLEKVKGSKFDCQYHDFFVACFTAYQHLGHIGPTLGVDTLEGESEFMIKQLDVLGYTLEQGDQAISAAYRQHFKSESQRTK
jgi:hypothetical protein